MELVICGIGGAGLDNNNASPLQARAACRSQRVAEKRGKSQREQLTIDSQNMRRGQPVDISAQPVTTLSNPIGAISLMNNEPLPCPDPDRSAGITTAAAPHRGSESFLSSVPVQACSKTRAMLAVVPATGGRQGLMAMVGLKW